jgi:transcription initiation factor IIE alpha subunit
MKKPHYCPECNSKMDAKKVERVVNSKSPEARNFDFSSVDGYLIGLIKFIWDEFHCPKCDNQLTVPEMKKYERQKNIA